MAEKARSVVAGAKDAYRAALAPYREACRKAGVDCEYEGGRSANVSEKVSFLVEKTDKGVPGDGQGPAQDRGGDPAGGAQGVDQQGRLRLYGQAPRPQGGDRQQGRGRCRTELAPAAGLSEGYLRQALHHLTRSGWLVRLRQGLYALSTSVPGATPAHEFEIAMALADPAAVSHWSALNHHGLTEQAPRKAFVLTTIETAVPRARGAKAKQARGGYPVDGMVYQFIQVKPERFFGTGKVWIGEARVTITDPERTLLDGLSMPQYCGDFAEVLHAFEAPWAAWAYPGAAATRRVKVPTLPFSNASLGPRAISTVCSR
ncbi:MAG TPA: type IV toxin-antitoxin system AbiEi family antitoxin domain-containing protein [Gemmatimonadales bacterium]